MDKFKKITAALAAFAAAVTLSGCASAKKDEIYNGEENGDNAIEIIPPVEEKPSAPEVAEPEEKENTVSYIKITADGVNVRTGAGAEFKSLGKAERGELYAYLGSKNGWYKTQFKNSTAYISESLCTVVEMELSGSDRVESVVNEGTKLLGTPYVYGAVRYHDGTGRRLANFTISKFDCSSLMQYIYYKGADELLNVNTRTQVYDGTTVKRSALKRGDLMFFTNSTRKNYTGIERIGHVAMYLGDNYILHTASDYAKIEQISQTRWSYFIQIQRII